MRYYFRPCPRTFRQTMYFEEKEYLTNFLWFCENGTGYFSATFRYPNGDTKVFSGEMKCGQLSVKGEFGFFDIEDGKYVWLGYEEVEYCLAMLEIAFKAKRIIPPFTSTFGKGKPPYRINRLENNTTYYYI